MIKLNCGRGLFIFENHILSSSEVEIMRNMNNSVERTKQSHRISIRGYISILHLEIWNPFPTPPIFNPG